jgi:hypothetical protein
MTEQECAELIGITRSGVFMREQSAFRKLRRLARAQVLFGEVWA